MHLRIHANSNRKLDCACLMVSAAPSSVPEVTGSESQSQQPNPRTNNASYGAAGRVQEASGSHAHLLTETWLDWQCKMIAGVHRALIAKVGDNSRIQPVATYPRTRESESRESRAALISLATNLSESGQKSILRQKQSSNDSAHGVYDNLALQLESTEGSYIVCLLLAPRTKSQLAAVQQLLLWGGMWLSSLNDLGLSSDKTAGSGFTSELLEADSVYASCCALSNLLKSRYGCERVSVGLVNGKLIRLVSLSQNTSFDRRQKLIRFIEAAMDESIEQRKTIVLPDDADSTSLVSAHRQLTNMNQSVAICTLPMQANGQVIGAVLLERESNKPFSIGEQLGCENLLIELGSAIELKIRATEKTTTRLYKQSRRAVQRLVSPETLRHRWQSLVAGIVLLAVLFFPVTHHVSATASIEGSDKQLLVSPLNGYIKSARYRAGDQVAEGDLIATLDNQDLLIDRDKWRSELKKLSTSYSQALSARNRSEIGLLQARKQQVSAELELVEQQLSRTELRAPFDGVLVSGDLNQSLGAPVEPGQVLFEIATLDDYRLILSVAERDVAAIQPGQESRLRLSALPGRTYLAQVESLMPVAVTEDGQNVFRVQAFLDSGDGELKPGMRGVAKIATERDPFIWVLVHPLLERLTLWFWSLA